MIQYLSGFADEAGATIETQIRATQQLGWQHIEMRNVLAPGFSGGNLHDISDEAFAVVAEQLEAANIRVNCFGTVIAKNAAAFDYDVRAAKNIACRAEKIGARFARVMSYPVHSLPEEEVFRRLREITSILSDGGVQAVVENCHNYAAMSASHAQRLIENVPGAALVFDPGNCVGFPDYSQPEPHPRQSAWEFYKAVRPYIVHFHVKDALYDGKNTHTFPVKAKPMSNASSPTCWQRATTAEFPSNLTSKTEDYLATRFRKMSVASKPILITGAAWKSCSLKFQ